jgi:hypothetical protein
MHGWEEMVAVAGRVYNSLPPADRPKTAIFGENYGEAGAVDLFGPKYDLPPAISGRQNYFFWGPRGYAGEIVIWLGGTVTRDRLLQMFQSAEVVAEVRNPYAMPYENFPVYLCRGFKGDLLQSWPRFKAWH